MAKVRSALGRGRESVQIQDVPEAGASLIRLATAEDDLKSLFTRKAQEIGMRVYGTSVSNLDRSLQTLFKELGATTFSISLPTGEHDKTVREVLRKTGGKIVDWRSRPGLDAQYDVDVGVTDSLAAIAETGTLIVSSDPDHSRGTFLVPPIHVALLRASQIVPDMVDCWGVLLADDSAAMSAATVLITGPSKTADIEGILVTGVHGPREVHVVLIEDA